MNCPYCEHGETKVIDTRVAGKGTIRRRRECLLCSQRMTTFERVEQAPLHVVKRDGSRQPFDRTKLMAGLKKSGVVVNRKALADLAVHDAAAFARLTTLAKDAVGVTTAA